MTTETQVSSEPFIFFELAGTTYGLNTKVVQQMEMIQHITPVPNAPSYVEGVVFSRGQVIPVVNLRSRFGFPKVPYDVRSRLIVVHSHNRTIGLTVDTAREFISVSTAAIQPPPEAISGLSGRYLSGIITLGERIILLLNVEELLQVEQINTVITSKADS